MTGHVFGITDGEVVRFGPLLATCVGRTVVDVAGGAPFDEGVITADGALHAGVPRELLLAAAGLVGPRRAARRIADVIAFADPGAESAAESRSRATMMRIGVEPPLLQYRLVLRDGREIALDTLFPSFMVGGEADGDVKILDPVIAPARETSPARGEEARGRGALDVERARPMGMVPVRQRAGARRGARPGRGAARLAARDPRGLLRASTRGSISVPAPPAEVAAVTVRCC